MIFGVLLSGSNYNDDEERLGGGRNGYGAKLTNIFSTEFTLETVYVNPETGEAKEYKQTWTDNMSKKGKPCIKAVKVKNQRGTQGSHLSQIFHDSTCRMVWMRISLP